MRRVLLAIALLTWSVGFPAVTTLDDVIASLGEIGCRGASVNYEVLLPSAADPVTYSVRLTYRPPPADQLSPCACLIGWPLPRGP
ncbi:MAG: hypothetical protein K2K84_06880, partial [Muribaculaceae bacterium]|nr:hypothetical protein [Muribaculaceae bacterium]